MNTVNTKVHLSPSPVPMSLDLFELLDVCETLSDELTEYSSPAHRQALYIRLAECLVAMKDELERPLPQYLIDRLTAEKLVDTQPQHIAEDSELLRQYCYVLTQVLMSQRQTAEVNEVLNGLLFELVNLLIEDLVAPRF